MIRGHGTYLRQILGPKLLMELDSDVGITIATGVSQWLDLSGRGNHVVQATGANQPTLAASVLDGHAAVRTDGITQYLENTALAGFAALSHPYIYTVYDPLSAIAGYNGNVYSFGNTAAEGVGHALIHLTTSTNLRASSNAGTISATGENGVTARLVTCRFGPGATLSTDVNNAQVGSGAISTNGLASIQNFLRIGTRFDNILLGNYDYFKFLVVNEAPTAAQHAALISYFKLRYPSLGLA